jgi:hypothetical protein
MLLWQAEAFSPPYRHSIAPRFDYHACALSLAARPGAEPEHASESKSQRWLRFAAGLSARATVDEQCRSATHCESRPRTVELERMLVQGEDQLTNDGNRNWKVPYGMRAGEMVPLLPLVPVASELARTTSRNASSFVRPASRPRPMPAEQQ